MTKPVLYVRRTVRVSYPHVQKWKFPRLVSSLDMNHGPFCMNPGKYGKGGWVCLGTSVLFLSPSDTVSSVSLPLRLLEHHGLWPEALLSPVHQTLQWGGTVGLCHPEGHRQQGPGGNAHPAANSGHWGEFIGRFIAHSADVTFNMKVF